MQKALIFGIDGQDGSYLADFLLQKDYAVSGWVPSFLPINYENISHSLPHVTLYKGNLLDAESLLECLVAAAPDEIYNLASPSFPAGSWDEAVLVGDVTGLGVTRLLDATRKATPKARYYQVSTSEVFGKPLESPQSEMTAFHPRNPYGVAKLYAHWMTINYREHYGLYAACGILFNHESPRRGPNFVTRKVTQAAARIKLGMQSSLHLGNLDARRDWGFARDYVEAMWLMLQRDYPDEFVIGTGVTHSVRDCCKIAFSHLDLDYRDFVRQEQEFFRPSEEKQLVANNSKARRELGWTPLTSFSEMIEMMVDHDLQILSSEVKCAK